ncbi:HD domain-containing protein [Nocardia sp. alder85J]|uniref:HD domain-containing protein n=1 Tax=Nocardia sp. alder85J TaxID=2862949 RepID=UPI001CD237E2|nr:HD domain-containing protein [Nocardia sp. alder85J]MCX4093118.1 HD domain-containing protein [Nocardia sp. alder85J]
MSPEALRQALTDRDGLDLRRLPEQVEVLLVELGAPPRLGAHLRAVHDVACELVAWLRTHFGGAEFDCDAVLFGAAIHDIGKVAHPEELSGPGSAHEESGYRLLIERGIDERLARFARTHASWTRADVEPADLLVGLADKVWKGKRVAELEQLVVRYLAAAGGGEAWQVYMALDDELTRIAADADRRLAFQAAYG